MSVQESIAAAMAEHPLRRSQGRPTYCACEEWETKALPWREVIEAHRLHLAAVAMDAARQAVAKLSVEEMHGYLDGVLSRAAVLGLLTPEGEHDA